MTAFSFILVILSTFTHAYWNYILKSTKGGLAFVWLFTLITTLLYFPFILYLAFRTSLELTFSVGLFLAGSVLFHLLYFFFLDKAYYFGDLSIIYPLTRSTAPLFTIAFALIVFKETLNSFQIMSIAMILIGTLLLSGISFSGTSKNLSATSFALLCATMISGYTLIDKYIVSTLAMTPFLLDFLNNLGRTLILSPLVFKRKDELKDLLKNNLKQANIIAVLSPLSYILVLFALRTAPVSLVAPLRQFSIIIAGIMGIHLLCESKSYLELSGIAMTFLGVVGMCF